MKIIIEINNEHQPFKLLNNDNIQILVPPKGAITIGNGNCFYIAKDNLSEDDAKLTIKSWFNQGFVDYSPKSDDSPNAATKIVIPIRRVIEIFILD